MVVIHRPDGKQNTSRNLRGIMDYARRRGIYVKAVHIARHGEHEGVLTVEFSDTAHCTTGFASFDILCQWVRARRSWHGAELFINSVPSGKTDKNNPPNINW